MDVLPELLDVECIVVLELPDAEFDVLLELLDVECIAVLELPDAEFDVLLVEAHLCLNSN